MITETKKQTVSNPIGVVVMCEIPLDLLKAIAHIGVDFGFGKYRLEQQHIDTARDIYRCYEPER